jgi:TolB-like protein
MTKTLYLFLLILIQNLFLYSKEKVEVNKSTDAYNQIAVEVSSRVANLENKKLAVLPFSYADSTGAIKDGSVIAERLTTALIKLGTVEVIERTALDKVIAELKLENTGVVDSKQSKELGKILGVGHILTGTLVPTAGGYIEVNARLIETETARSIAAFQVKVLKNWVGGEVKKNNIQGVSEENIRRILERRRFPSPTRE